MGTWFKVVISFNDMQWNKGRVKNQGIESITWIIFSTEFVLFLAAEKTGSVVPLAMFFSMIALSQLRHD